MNPFPWLPWRIPAALIAGHLLIDLMLPGFLNGQQSRLNVWPFLLLGVCVSQVNLIAAWAVFAPGAIAWRWPWAALWGTLMWGVLVLGNRIGDSDGIPRAAAMQMGAVIIGGIMAAQVPLWMVRWFVQYRLVPPQRGSVDERQFNLRQMLIGTAALAAALGLVQALMPERSPHVSTFRELAVILPIVGTVNLLLTLPCMWLALTKQPGQGVPLPALIVILAVYALALTTCELLVFAALMGDGDGELFVILLAFNAAQAGSICISLALLRWGGFRWEPRQARLASVGVVLAEVVEESSGSAEVLPASPTQSRHPLDS